MRMISARGACALVVCVLAAGCATLQRQAFREPEVAIDAAALAGGLQSQHLELDLEIYNPNNYRLDASRIRYKLLVDSVDLANGMIERRVTLPPRDSTTVRAPVDVNRQELPGLFVRTVANSGILPFQLVGEMRIETTFGSVTRQFDQRGTIEPFTGRVTIFKRK